MNWIPPRNTLVLCVALFCVGGAVGQDAVVLDFPRSSLENQPLPLGLKSWPLEATSGLVGLEIPLLPLNSEGSLMVTAVFLDEEARVILAKWVSPDLKTTVVAANLSEGIQGWNQRTFKVPFELLETGGSLVLETDADTQPVKRLLLNWAWPAGVSMSVGAQSVEYVQSENRIFTESEISSTPSAPSPDSWTSGIWKAYLQEPPASLEEGIEFIAPMAGAPRAAILRAEVLGLPLEATLEIWVNGTKLALVRPDIPELGSPGYFTDSDGKLGYAGWMKVAAILPASLLKDGENSVIVGAQAKTYIKKTMMELNFRKEASPFLPLASEGPLVATVPAEEELVIDDGLIAPPPPSVESIEPRVTIVTSSNPNP